MRLLPMLFLLLGQSFSLVMPAQSADLPLDRIKLPEGFDITVYAKVPGARSMTLGSKGTLFVGTRDSKVFAIPTAGKEGIERKVYTIATGLNQPNGVAFRDGALYIAEISRISKIPGIEDKLQRPPALQTVSKAFPKDEHHGWKFIAFGPDGKLYVPVGAPCNICDPGERYAAIFRMNPDGTGLERFAKGIRNTVGFDWHPQTKELWFTDNGRDMMGDDVPPDELNRAPKPGLDFGYPRCHGKDVIDPEFGKPGDCDKISKPELLLTPHSAALGMRFYQADQFPASYKNAIFIAQHGSWNRSSPVGYRVMVVTFDGKKAREAQEFASGWLGKGGEAWGRPVDIQQSPDGALFVSDDKAGVIYRISYRKSARKP